jgi:hypothetical protein
MICGIDVYAVPPIPQTARNGWGTQHLTGITRELFAGATQELLLECTERNCGDEEGETLGLAFFIELLIEQWSSDLAPVAFDQDPAAAAVDPVVGNPVRAGMGWAIPAAGDPDVTGAVPAMITGDPHKAAIGRRRTALNDGGRWANANHHLRK